MKLLKLLATATKSTRPAVPLATLLACGRRPRLIGLHSTPDDPSHVLAGLLQLHVGAPLLLDSPFLL